eukprot:CAMPEP_0118683762 /NCGR_PEP_ID=MMETSP0800-20121206/6238_1 /TAXON_ID=210618 ORGANISM="Striatella unipunctata, Strain CCMP2910" /NCGR_SAMPLE_ID=MMETSP0800 /ASSEMBLY_ACC=CAM_ASM_000638 /LENGTH=60 /DNA_ID=CAMNT_0006580333 /DNA_START=1305 /DNA_END=1487 /DNA_ORIENTATION=-
MLIPGEEGIWKELFLDWVKKLSTEAITVPPDNVREYLKKKHREYKERVEMIQKGDESKNT